VTGNLAVLAKAAAGSGAGYGARCESQDWRYQPARPAM